MTFSGINCFSWQLSTNNYYLKKSGAWNLALILIYPVKCSVVAIMLNPNLLELRTFFFIHVSTSSKNVKRILVAKCYGYYAINPKNAGRRLFYIHAAHKQVCLSVRPLSLSLSSHVSRQVFYSVEICEEERNACGEILYSPRRRRVIWVAISDR